MKEDKQELMTYPVREIASNAKPSRIKSAIDFKRANNQASNRYWNIDRLVGKLKEVTVELADSMANGTSTHNEEKKDLPVVETGAIPENSVIKMLKVGDKVLYPSNGVDIWRVFEVTERKVLITPAIGGVGKVALKGPAGYKNAIKKIELECKKYVNQELGVGWNDVRSMTIEDILRIANCIPKEDIERCAFYLDGAKIPGKYVTRNGKSYKTETFRPQSYAKERLYVPKFYEYDYAKYTGIDKNGYTYAYPFGDEPVYITCSCSNTLNPGKYHHKDNEEIKVSDLLMNDGWLASTCIYILGAILMHGVTFDVYHAYEGLVYSESLFISGDKNYYRYAKGVHPLVSLNPSITAVKEDEVWVLSK